MEKLVILGVACGLVLPACGSSATCEEVGKKLAGVAKKEKADVPSAEEFAEVCKEQKWSEEMRKCLVSASTGDAVTKCMTKSAEFQKYADKSKTTEALEYVRKMYDGARSYYMDPGSSAASIVGPMAPRFPTPSAGPTPPLGECCKQGGKCAPDPALWQEAPWPALYFAIDDPHYFSYQYEVVDPEKKFVVRAFGDLDCDGDYSTFEMTGEITDENPDGPGRGELIKKNELE